MNGHPFGRAVAGAVNHVDGFQRDAASVVEGEDLIYVVLLNKHRALRGPIAGFFSVLEQKEDVAVGLFGQLPAQTRRAKPNGRRGRTYGQRPGTWSPKAGRCPHP